MTYHIIETDHDQLHIRLTGIFSVQDFLALQKLTQQRLEQDGSIRALYELTNFEGWSKNAEAWEETTFINEKDFPGSKIAFVGDEQWRDDIFMFIGKPLRAMDIQFFPENQFGKAKAWLRSS